MSEYVSDDTFVQRQKEDIQELTSMFRDMLDNSGTDNEQEYLEEFRKVFVPQPGFEARYVINIEEKKNPLWIAIGSGALECGYGETEKPDVEMQMNRAAMEDIVNGRMTFQRAFMSGIMKRMKEISEFSEHWIRCFPLKKIIDRSKTMKKEDCISVKLQTERSLPRHYTKTGISE